MFADLNGVQLYYDVQGAGPPLMLMHGGLGFDHSYFRPWLGPLSEQMQLVYYDHRGNGRSTPLQDFNGIDHATWADDADALRRHLGHDKIFLLGHSCGGFVALEYALRYNRHLAGLILCCTTPAMDYPEIVMTNAQAKATSEQLPVVAQMFSTPLVSDDDFRNGLMSIFSLYFKHYNSSIGEGIVNAMHLNYRALNYALSTWFPSVNFLPRLHEISVPTVIIGGREDWIMPPAQGAARLHAGIRKSQMVIFEESGHCPFVEERDRFNKVISDWIVGLK
jgi:proline iminopeptidase